MRRSAEMPRTRRVATVLVAGWLLAACSEPGRNNSADDTLAPLATSTVPPPPTTSHITVPTTVETTTTTTTTVPAPAETAPTATALPAMEPLDCPELTWGMADSLCVSRMQLMMNRLGCASLALGFELQGSGTFGDNTAATVIFFQERFGLANDGRFGPDSQAAANQANAAGVTDCLPA